VRELGGIIADEFGRFMNVMAYGEEFVSSESIPVSRSSNIEY